MLYTWLTCTYILQDCGVCHVGYDRKDMHSPGGKDAEVGGTAPSCSESKHTLDL